MLGVCCRECYPRMQCDGLCEFCLIKKIFFFCLMHTKTTFRHNFKSLTAVAIKETFTYMYFYANQNIFTNPKLYLKLSKSRLL